MKFDSNDPANKGVKFASHISDKAQKELSRLGIEHKYGYGNVWYIKLDSIPVTVEGVTFIIEEETLMLQEEVREAHFNTLNRTLAQFQVLIDVAYKRNEIPGPITRSLNVHCTEMSKLLKMAQNQKKL